jgi:hypothetical protein
VLSDQQAVIEGSFSPFQYYIDLDTKIAIELPPKTNESYFFDYNIKTWMPDSEKQWKLVSEARNTFLQNSDWTQLPDVPLSTKESWAVYRQALRDITLQPDPFNITWPQPPN